MLHYHTPLMLEELVALEDVDVRVDPSDLVLEPASEAANAPNTITANRNGMATSSGRASQRIVRARRQLTQAAARISGVVNAATKRCVYSITAFTCGGGMIRP